MSKWVVLDIEGTLSATDQVLVVLYDYARPRLGPWIEQHGDDPVVADAVKQIKELAGHDDVVKALHDWMDADQKVTPLKTLQGLIWQQGYAQGDLVAEFFPDVVPAIRKWHDDGIKLAIFSSGSVAGQIAFFQHTTDGDLTPLLEHHFDTVQRGPEARSRVVPQDRGNPAVRRHHLLQRRPGRAARRAGGRLEDGRRRARR